MSQALTIPWAGQEEFLHAAQALLPPGDAWPRETDATLTALLGACVAALARLHARAADLTEREAQPHHAQELLPAWEGVYNLPDPCSPVNASIPQRQAAVAARMAAHGGQTAAYFIGVAAQMGYAVTITTFTPPQYNVARFNQARFYAVPWRFVWQVNSPSFVAFPAKFNASTFGERYVAFSSGDLACVLTRIKPAYSLLIMNYGGV